MATTKILDLIPDSLKPDLIQEVKEILENENKLADKKKNDAAFQSRINARKGINQPELIIGKKL